MTATPCGHQGRQIGFTLVELLVAFAIGALLVGLVPLAFGKLRESSQYRDTVRTMVSELRQARQQALAKGVEVRFQVDMSGRHFGIQGALQRPLPQSLNIRATVGSIEVVPDQVVGVLFLPDGGASGGSFDILRESGSGTRVRVDWLSGRVEQAPIQP